MSANARNVISFNSDWTFNDRPVTIPHTWNAYDMQVRYNDFLQGANYYRKHFTPDESLKGKRIYLRFEGVGSCAEVYVNHQMVGTHKGGYSAFVVEIGKELKWGEDNLIVVKADNTARPDVIPVNHVLFGVYGGIYRPVWLVATDSCSIAVNDYASPGIYIRQKNVNKKGADVSVKVKLDNATFKTVGRICKVPWMGYLKNLEYSVHEKPKFSTFAPS
jgi:beta-galactosidase